MGMESFALVCFVGHRIYYAHLSLKAELKANTTRMFLIFHNAKSCCWITLWCQIRANNFLETNTAVFLQKMFNCVKQERQKGNCAELGTIILSCVW